MRSTKWIIISQQTNIILGKSCYVFTKKFRKFLYFVMYLSLKITSVLLHYIINWIDFNDNETYCYLFEYLKHPSGS